MQLALRQWISGLIIAGAALLVRSDPVEGQVRWKQVSAGGAHTCAITTDGTAYCWGAGSSGRLGNTKSSDSAVPVAVAGNIEFVSISVGKEHACGTTTDHTVLCWGKGTHGQLGIGTSGVLGQAMPSPVAGDFEFASVAAGYVGTCGITTEGELACWGDARKGAMAMRESDAPDRCTFEPCVSAPTSTGRGTYTAVAVGDYASCAINKRGGVLCWGSNHMGRLGINKTDNKSDRLVPINAPHTFSQVAISGHGCALTNEGKAFCWGPGTDGQIGDGKSTFRKAPVPVKTELTFKQITVGEGHTCAIASDDNAYCWGTNQHGRLGTGGQTGIGSEVKVPTRVDGPQFRSISAGFEHTCAIDLQGGLWCWGRAGNGRLGNGDAAKPQAKPVQVSAPAS